MKPFIKFCTPYLNEWDIDPQPGGIGAPVRNNPPLPIEDSFDALARVGGVNRYDQGMIIDTPAFTFRWVRVRGTYIARSRNALVNNCRSDAIHQKLVDEFSHYLFVDSDVSFTYEDVVKLIEADKPIISGAYMERTHRNCFCAGEFQHGHYLTFLPNIHHGLKKVEWCGAGFLLVKREVFETIPFRWFNCIDWNYKDENGRECIDSWEEDVSFCQNAKASGYEIWIDCDCRVEHHLNNKPRRTKVERIDQLKCAVWDWTAQRDILNQQINAANNEIIKIINEQNQAKQAAKADEPKGE